MVLAGALASWWSSSGAGGVGGTRGGGMRGSTGRVENSALVVSDVVSLHGVIAGVGEQAESRFDPKCANSVNSFPRTAASSASQSGCLHGQVAQDVQVLHPMGLEDD
jgi:hypothetical protein